MRARVAMVACVSCFMKTVYAVTREMCSWTEAVVHIRD